MIRFFFFGCWNRDNCSDKSPLDYRTAVIDAISEKASEFNFGIVAGDNIYPYKADKSKKYYEKTLTYAFDAMNKVKTTVKSKKIYATIGNHDVVNKSILEAQLKHGVFDMPSNLFVKTIPSWLRIIFIDTNLLQNDHKLPAVYSSDDPLIQGYFQKDIRDGKAVLGWLDEELKKNHEGWTIVVGHEPIKTIKAKKSYELAYSKELIQILSQDPHTIYMCADTHNFQGVHLSEKLLMIVAGTGGATPDESLPTEKNSLYNLFASESPYGYCDVVCTKDRLEISYRHLSGCNQATKDITITVYHADPRAISYKEYDDASTSLDCKATKTVAAQCNVTNAKVLEGGKHRSRRINVNTSK